jgi:CcmD family protein
MIRRTFRVFCLAIWIGIVAPAPLLAEGGSGAPAAEHGGIAQMEPSTQTDDRPLDLEKEKTRSRFRYLMLGYGLIWLSIGAYLIQMNRRVARVGQEIDELKGRLDDLSRVGRTPER